ncbi:alpha/beta fold hydrolase [Roseisolibacter sp. H3M3-2]|uniref:alpha/beta hydrolase family protein n=1 Tax=Roseisolibacter sp. H3M3-2 TaxID=3031323 RepID=UPI0023DA8885|nr:alpha/beta fold hydrolase [Roseisolibacter sp. H3M3-2]MDF1504923.1 alpha/beta fold hydrolase [Roseisolibacter sp. H3M3-2]
MRPLLVVLALAAGAARPQPPADRFVGTWQGTLQSGAQALRLGLQVRRDSAGTLAGEMVSIDQGGVRLPAVLAVRGDTLVATMGGAGATFTGVLTRDSLLGRWAQGGGSGPLAMGRVAALATAAPPKPRPQDPAPPFPYRTEEVRIASAPGVTLAGTLVLPPGDGPFPAAVLVSGSGPQDRDETLLGHRPFLVLADHLARRGIATLRYDDRGTAGSTGDFAAATSVDLAADAEAAVRVLRARAGVRRDAVGIVGHSEGGLIAPLVASRTPDVAFAVLLAGPGVPGDSILLLQQRLIAAAQGVPTLMLDQLVASNRRVFAAVRASRDSADAARRVGAVLDSVAATLPEAQRAAARRQLDVGGRQVLTPWMRHFVVYDPRPALRATRVPVLALNGTLDLQVPYAENLRAVGAALREGGNRDVTLVEMPGLNHLFQTAKTGAPAEYATIEETFAPAALERVSGWILARFGRK